MPIIDHLIITRFSYKGVYPHTLRSSNPLKTKNLKHRFNLFAMTCLPSVLQQEHQDFKWIVIVDARLKSHFRTRLEKLISRRVNSFIYEYKPNDKMNRTDWLRPFINTKADYLITTNLDDDDALFTGFTQAINDHYSGLINQGKAPYFQFLGCNGNVLQWDYFWSAKAPLGYVKPWTRLNSLPLSVGYSLFIKYPEIDFSFFCHGHHQFGRLREYLRIKDGSAKPDNSESAKFLAQIEHTALENTCRWDGKLSAKENFHILKNPPLQVVVANHIENKQYQRIFENDDLRVPLDEEISFPGMAIDFDVARANIYKFKKSLRVLIRALLKTIQVSEQYKKRLNPIERVKRKYKNQKNTIRGVKNLI